MSLQAEQDDLQERDPLNPIKSIPYPVLSTYTSIDDVVNLESTVEVPQGRHLGIFGTCNMFISRIIGNGIFSIPSSVFINCGGNLIIYFTVWVLAAILSFFGLYLYLEFGCLIPKNGGTKNFLEFSFDKPKYMTSVVFGGFTILTGFAISSALIFGEYFMFSIGFSQDFVANNKWPNHIGSLTTLLIAITHGISLKTGVYIQNTLGVLKIFIVSIMSISGALVLLAPHLFTHDNKNIGFPPLTDLPGSLSYSSLSTAFIQAFFCYIGWNMVHSVTAEIINPNKTLKLAGSVSLLITLVCYSLVNLAYVRLLTYNEIVDAGPLLGSILFTRMYGEIWGRKFITFSIAISALSNLFVALYSISRVNQEIFRHGYFPFTEQLSKNWPFNSPFPSLLVSTFLTIGWLTLLPPGNGVGYNYLVSLEAYGSQIVLLFVAIGIFVYKWKHPNLKPADIKSSSVGNAFFIIFSFYLVVTPFIFNDSGYKNSLPYFPSYYLMTIILFSFSFLFWLVKFQILPKIFRYKLVPELYTLEDGLIIQKWDKIYS
ncbi:Mup3p SCDLUD_001342 [Saccharomycodes ludwigii]|uniref:Mup3p n=1 Tax=Saccharomycodes ludwigii TaxID=36035 RepID=UPI001E8A62FE|nr:hypothetical protein SCDLUD_001342 [Saccharomycodes ludwigii]KAH3901579.1 hypothetical protein SCDLUD_001342 [Saccharomycodes ludwigii]